MSTFICTNERVRITIPIPLGMGDRVIPIGTIGTVQRERRRVLMGRVVVVRFLLDDGHRVYAFLPPESVESAEP